MTQTQQSTEGKQCNKFFMNDFSNHLYITVVENKNYFDTPTYNPTLMLPAQLIATDNSFRDEYFESILQSDMRIKFINGICTHMDYRCLHCDYCNSNIGNFNKKNQGYWRCWDCQLDMCNLCYSNINGCDKQFGRDKRECITHKFQKRINVTAKRCNLCDNKIWGNIRWSDNVSENVSDVGDVSDSKDVCEQCASKSSGMQYIYTWKLQQIETNRELLLSWENMQFGSMMDWIPICKDQECGLLLMNCNPESDLFERMCLATCNYYGAFGYFTVPSEYTIQMLLNKMSETFDTACVKLKESACEEDRNKFLSPIQTLMEFFNMSIT